MAQFGRALRSGRKGRRFESCHPDQEIKGAVSKLSDQRQLRPIICLLYTSEKHPNIVFLQLESFIDPMTIESIGLDKEACPNFRKLVENYPSGQLTVPACGAGTANVEFEVMSGLSVKFFGPGEYPYKLSLIHIYL